MSKDKQKGRFNSHLIENHEMRVFLSSTFSDMDAERSALVKLFHKLKLEANRRNVTLSLLDLRWGVTEEESRTGKVLSVCLNEIENSHPFFIGLLGSRYGSAPKVTELEKNPDLKERYPWIVEDIKQGLSITEMEMQYGVLRNQDKVDAVFFIKKTPDNVPDDNEKLTALKSKLREQSVFPVEDYLDAEDLCEKVEKHITNILNKYFPNQLNSRLEQVRSEQMAQVNRHVSYVKNHIDYRLLKWFMVKDDMTHFVIMGNHGSGKSAMLANWLKEILAKGDDFSHNIIYHFIGSNSSNDNTDDILQHLCDEICDLYDIDSKELPSESLKDKAQRLLVEAGQKGKPVLIVIDGISHISDDEEAGLLEWMPQAPQTTKYILSCLSHTDLADIFYGRDEYYCHSLEPLSEELRKEFITGYLANVGKKLDNDQLRRIIVDSENENMLVLKTLLDELISFGSYERLDDYIEYYLSASSVEVFFDRLLQRMESDYIDVSHILSLIAVSYQGLTDAEIIALTQMRPIDYYLFYGAFYNHLNTLSGKVVFAHQFIEKAVRNRYKLYTRESIQSYCDELISYFTNNRDIDSNRKISELTHLYYQIEDCQKLHDILLNVDSFNYFSSTENRSNAFVKYWKLLLNNNSNNYQFQDYLSLNFNKADDYDFLGKICYYDFADYELSLKAYQLCLELTKKERGEKSVPTARVYICISNIYSALNKYEEALEWSMNALKIQKQELGEESTHVAASYSNIGCACASLGHNKEALNYFIKSVEISERVLDPRHPALAQLYNNLGSMYQSYGKRRKAFECYQKAMEVVESNFGSKHRNTAESYLYVGDGYYAYHYNLEARHYYLKALEILIPILGTDHPRVADCHRKLGVVYCNLEDYDEANENLLKAINIYKSVYGERHEKVAQVYNLMGELAFFQGKETVEMYNKYKALIILKLIFGKNDYRIANSYRSLGFNHLLHGNIKKAFLCYTESVRIGIVNLF